MSPTEVARHRVRGWDHDRRRPYSHEFEGRLLAQASTQARDHVPEVHGPGSYAPPRERCSACRWSELRIYRTTDDTPTWVIEQVGASVVPGETYRYRVRRVDQARYVVATLVVPDAKSGEIRVPPYARRALDEAARHDRDLASVVDDLLVYD